MTYAITIYVEQVEAESPEGAYEKVKDLMDNCIGEELDYFLDIAEEER